MAYDLRSATDPSTPKNYRELNELKLPRPERVKAVDKLYAVEVIEEDGDRVKIHYVGYEDRFDEWRQREELENWHDDDEHGGQQLETELYQPFDLHQELAYHIKSSLKGSRKDPVIRIEMPFDHLLFNGGLKCCGKLLRKSRGHDIYGLSHYADLRPLLGDRWHLRILNPRRDFCYVHLETVEYWLHKRKSIQEFDEEGHAIVSKKGGYILVFRFVRMDKVQSFLSSVLELE